MRELTDEVLGRVIRARARVSHKGDYGRVLVIGGNAEYGGAVILAASAAVYAGAGLVTVATDRVNHAALHARLPEAMVLDLSEKSKAFAEAIEKSDVIVIGCGLGLSTAAFETLSLVLATISEKQWLVIDGSAITLFSENHCQLRWPERTVFTPHQMELARLSGLAIEQQSLDKVQDFVNQLGATLVAKSYETAIYRPSQAAEKLTVGTPAQATGGMGDTLAGMIGGFLGQFKSQTAVSVAVYLHSCIAQELAQENYVVLPSQIISELPRAMKKWEAKI